MARTISDAVTEICSLRSGIENAAWEEARGKLMAYLRLKGSCVGGDQEEYDALKDEIERFIERIDEDDIYSPSHDEITRLREENGQLREALLFAELMASEIGIDPREKCQRIYDELYKIRTAATAIQDGGNNDPE